MLVGEYGRWHINAISLAYIDMTIIFLLISCYLSEHLQDPYGQNPTTDIAKHLNIFIIQL